MKIATTVKLTRALWIVPLALFTSIIFKKKDQKIAIPHFILFFILAMLINTFLLGDYPMVGEVISKISKQCLNVALFFIGAGLSRDVLKSVGAKALFLGITLWVLITASTLMYIYWA